MNDGLKARSDPGHCQVCGWPVEKYGCGEDGCHLPNPYANLEKAAAKFRDTAGREFGIYRLLDRIVAWLNGLRKG